jgi:hypothetical protein
MGSSLLYCSVSIPSGAANQQSGGTSKRKSLLDPLLFPSSKNDIKKLPVSFAIAMTRDKAF